MRHQVITALDNLIDAIASTVAWLDALIVISLFCAVFIGACAL